MAVSDSTRLLAPGVEVTLADGKAYPLRFDFEAMHYIEDHFGDLEAVPTVLNQSGWGEKRIHKLSSIFVAALIHTGMQPEEIIHLLRFKDIVHYIDALVAAFNQAMPDGEPAPKAKGGSAGSPGNGSTRSPRRVMDARSRSSGG